MSEPMGLIKLRMSAELVDAIDAAASERHATRSAVIRAVLEDAIDVGALPAALPAPATTAELLEQLRDDELERLREIVGD